MLEMSDGPEPNPNLLLPVPSFAQIGWMKENVQRLQGVLLSKVCRPRGIPYPADDGVRSIMVNTTGCGNETMALVPYEKPDGSSGSLEVCLICDGFIEWPRGDEPQPEPGPGALPPLDPGAGWVSGP